MRFSSKKQHQRGFTLLIAILLATIVLAIGTSILNLTLKEFILSNVARESAISLGAADAGLECALYWDRSTQGNRFDIPITSSAGLPINFGAGSTNISCMGQSIEVGGGQSGTVQEFEIEWSPPNMPDDKVCAKVSVTKYTNAYMDVAQTRRCPPGIECTRTVSYGYNNACDNLGQRNTVERALRALY